MAMYFEGYMKARDIVLHMSEEEMLAHIDGLYGRSNLSSNYSLEDLRREALKQTKRDWTDTSSPEYADAQLLAKIAERNRRIGRP